MDITVYFDDNGKIISRSATIVTDLPYPGDLFQEKTVKHLEPRFYNCEQGIRDAYQYSVWEVFYVEDSASALVAIHEEESESF